MKLEMSHDLLLQRLASLDDVDLKSLLVGGLRLREARVSGLSHTDLVTLCSSRLRVAACSSTVNRVRGRGPHDFPYKQLLIDVADKLTPGLTPFSWTQYRLNDEHPAQEVEQFVLDLFEERARKWWARLPDRKREAFVDGINSILSGDEHSPGPIKKGAAPFLQQQAIEQLIQSGLITGLSKVSAGGLLGVAGISLVGQMGWLILVQTVGWMAGLKIAVFGIGGYGALGGAVTVLGASAVSAAVALPGLVLLFDGPAYRKTVPTTVMLLAKTRLDNFARKAPDSGVEAGT